MSELNLKTLHTYLRFFENPAEVKRKLPNTHAQRTLKEGVTDIGRLIGQQLNPDPETLGKLIGPQRFGVVYGEPSTTDLVLHCFDTAKIAFTVLVDPSHYEATMPQTRAHGIQPGVFHPAQPRPSQPYPGTPPTHRPGEYDEHEGLKEGKATVQHLRDYLAQNPHLGLALFRIVFEHTLGASTQASVQAGPLAHASELLGRRENTRVLIADTFYLLGRHIEPEHVTRYMVEHNLLGMHTLEHKFLTRDYCTAFYVFQKLRRVFVDSPAEEEARLRARINQLNCALGGAPTDARLFELSNHDKVKIDALHAATDLIEALAHTVMGSCLGRAATAANSNCLRLIKGIATHFERFGTRQEPPEVANREIGEILFGFAVQFSCLVAP